MAGVKRNARYAINSPSMSTENRKITFKTLVISAQGKPPLELEVPENLDLGDMENFDEKARMSARRTLKALKKK